MQFRGTWSPNRSYTNASLVLYNGAPYVSTAPATSRFPPPGLPWVALVANAAANDAQISQLLEAVIVQTRLINALDARIGQLEARPVSGTLQLSTAGISLLPNGGTLSYADLLPRLLDVPVKIGDLSIMAFRSALGRMLARLAAEEAATVDISANRLPAVASLIVSNEALDAARELAQQLRDAQQDVSGALLQLAAASAQSDIAAVSARVTVLESAPAFDATAILASLADVSGAAYSAAAAAAGALYAAQAAQSTADSKTDSAYVDSAVAAAVAGLASESYVDTAVGSAVSGLAATSYVDSAVLSAVAPLATSADLSSGLAAKEDKGLVSALIVEQISTVGVSAAYWAETIGSVIAAAADAGKIADYAFDAPASEIVLPAGTPAAGAVRRIRNAHESAVLPVSLGGSSYEIVAGETAVFQYSGSAWRLL